MTYIDSMIEFMQSNQFQRSVIEVGEVSVFYRADGSTLTTNERPSAEQAQQILNEVMPDKYHSWLPLSIPFNFPYTYAGQDVDVSVDYSQGHILISINAVFASAGDEWEAAPSAGGRETSPGSDFSPAVTQLQLEQSDAPPPSLRQQRDFPKQLPKILAIPESRLRLYCAVIGVLLGVLTSVVIYLVTSAQSTLGQIFNLRSLAAAIPVTISSIFFWGMTLCFVRWRRLRHLEKASSKSLLLSVTKFLVQGGPKETFRELDDDMTQENPLLRRLQAVLQQWMIRPGLQDADILLQQHIASDEEAVHSGYSLIRTFVWALPVLGLIGTVIGISLAVGEFAQFLGGNIEDIKVVKEQLVGVTGGLSFAFLVTLQGLLTSLLMMLVSSTLQTREERLYSSIQQNISDAFIPGLQKVAPLSDQASDARGITDWGVTLQNVARDMLETIRDECSRMAKTIQDAFVQGQVSDWAETLRREIDAGAKLLGATFENTGREMSKADEGFLDHLSQVREALDAQTVKLQELLEAQADSLSRQHSDAMTAMAEQTATVREGALVLAALAETTSDALESQDSLKSALLAFGESSLGQILTEYTRAVSAQTDGAQITADAVRGLTILTQDVLASQASLQMAVRQLNEIGFDRTLASVSDSLHKVGEVLVKFREPFVFQAVPVAKSAP